MSLAWGGVRGMGGNLVLITFKGLHLYGPALNESLTFGKDYPYLMKDDVSFKMEMTIK